MRARSKRQNDFVDIQSKKKIKTSLPASVAESDIKSLEKNAHITYLESVYEIDKPDCVYIDGVWLLNDGLGLYAAKDIPKGTIIGEYTGELMDSANPDSSYTMYLEKDRFVDAEKKGNFTRFINHSEYQNNCDFVKLKKCNKIINVVQTNRYIKAGEQLLVNYNIYNSEESKKYYFLSPLDSGKSASEYLKAHETKYQFKKITADCPGLNVSKDECIYVSKIGGAILDQKHLSKNFSQVDLTLRFLKVKKESEEVMQFNEFDSLNALMLAAYFGQLDNLKWLLAKNANQNAQQTISGRNALFFVIEGLKDKKCSIKDCVAVILTLIQHKANIFIHNKNEEIFLFSAVKYLDAKNLKPILNTIFQRNKKVIQKIATYINDNNEDIFLYCIKNKCFENLQVLLEYFPSYFEDNIGSTKKHFYSVDRIKALVNNFNAKEKTTLKNIFIKYKLENSLVKNIFFDKTKKLKNYNLKQFDYNDESMVVDTSIDLHYTKSRKCRS